MNVLVNVCSSLVHSARRPAAHFCPPVSWWPSAALQSSAGTSWCRAPPPPVEQGVEERRRKTKTEQREYMQTGRQVMEMDEGEGLRGWWMSWHVTVQLWTCAVDTGHSHAPRQCMSCMCICDRGDKSTVQRGGLQYDRWSYVSIETNLITKVI